MKIVKYILDLPILLESNISVAVKSTKKDVRDISGAYISDRSRPVYIDGEDYFRDHSRI